MKSVTGKILSIEIDVPVEKKDGGTYKGWKIAYKNLQSGKTEELAKPMAGLKYQPGLKASLDGLTRDDEFTFDMEKNDKGYWEVVSIRKGAEMPVPADAGSAPAKTYKTDRSSSYETPDERKDKQSYIVRQTSLDKAVQLVIAGKVETKDALKLAEKFEAWVMRKAEEPEAKEVE